MAVGDAVNLAESSRLYMIAWSMALFDRRHRLKVVFHERVATDFDKGRK